ncbi:MAG: diaminopimelate decarboxylase [Lachnospiraceae bacterium]|nr:diaminopimelate decarboxylase [Lachnospiraceae bacterium]
MNAEVFNTIKNEYSTPAFVFDEDELLSRAGSIRQILGGISFCYSIKANPFLIPAADVAVDYFEVCSPGELAICKALKVSPEKIIYSGVHKEADDIEDALSYGAAVLTAESLRHYHLICDASARLKKHAKVLLRLTSKNQFGMSLEDIETILEKSDENVTVIGLHYFAGTGRKQAKKQIEELGMLTDIVCRFKEKYGDSFHMLEYGPGLPYPYFEDDDFSDTLMPLKNISEALSSVSLKCSLSVEMGRFLASSCGYYLTSICDLKKSSDNNWCITDGGINHVNYLGQMMGMKVPVISHLRDGAEVTGGMKENYSVCGSLCTTNDMLIRSFAMNDPKIGDLLVFSNIGAYSVTEAPALFLSRTLPCILACRNGNIRLLRKSVESWKINIQDS